jgi:hypothetical protein
MPEQFYAVRVLLCSDGLSSGAPTGDARCYALRTFDSSPFAGWNVAPLDLEVEGKDDI